MSMQSDDVSQLLQLAKQLDFASFVPPAFQDYLPLIEEGLACFVDQLPPQRRWQIIADQAELPSSATPQQRMVHWMRSCPTLHKLGQLLARDQRLPEPLRRELQTLESLPPETSGKALRLAVETELGPLENLQITLGDAAIAEASVAIVVPFDSPAGPGVLKVLKGEIHDRLEEDLAAWDALAEFLDKHRVRLKLDHIDYADTLQRVRELVSNEVDLTIEQSHLAEAAAFYRDDKNIAIPELLPYCTPRVTAMRRIDGPQVMGVDDRRRSELAKLVVSGLVIRPVFNNDERALFHGDPHAGNLLAPSDGRLGIIDWGLAGHLSKFQREQVTQILVGCLTLDAGKICEALGELAVRVPDPQSLRTCVNGVLRKLALKIVPGMMCVMDLLDSVVMGGHAVFAENLLLFRKLLHIVEGVVADLDPQCSLDQMMLGAGCWQFAEESWMRVLADPCSRAFGTHLSNLDMMEIMWSGPLVSLRRWGLVFQA